VQFSLSSTYISWICQVRVNVIPKED
jgi:hypothetical protein